MSFHRRRLPHQYPRNRPLFLTWHLHRSLPQGVYPPPGNMSDGQAFAWMDRYLDTTALGPMFLPRAHAPERRADCKNRGPKFVHRSEPGALCLRRLCDHGQPRPCSGDTSGSAQPAAGVARKGLRREKPTRSWEEPESRSGSTNRTTTGFETLRSSNASDVTSRTTL